jgi:hypothetical protein
MALAELLMHVAGVAVVVVQVVPMAVIIAVQLALAVTDYLKRRDAESVAGEVVPLDEVKARLRKRRR